MEAAITVQAAGPLAAPAVLPEGLRIYAVGDIHGHLDLLQALYAGILRDLEAVPVRESVEVFLGDYIDRGPQSAGVLRWLIEEPKICGQRISLMGNHEDMLIRVLEGAGSMEHWLENGGQETLRSFGVTPPSRYGAEATASARGELIARMPESCRAFLHALRRSATYGPYVFAHAGIQPGRPLAAQDPDDLVWIREPFLSCTDDLGCVVVHGHTPVHRPEVRANRINIDTGAFTTGRLTCAVLEGDTLRFLQTARG